MHTGTSQIHALMYVTNTVVCLHQNVLVIVATILHLITEPA